MVPAFSATLKSAAAPVTRLGFLYVPNGVAMNDALNFWTPKGGADIRLTTTADQIAAAQLGTNTVLPSMKIISF